MRNDILKKRLSLIALAFVVISASVPEPLRADGADPDSTSYFGFSAIYSNRIRLLRDSSPFPWNDPAIESELNDRAVLLFQAIPFDGAMLFLKGATGVRNLDEEGYGEGAFLEQGDLRYLSAGDRIGLRIFMRERVFRTRNRALNLLSDDLTELSQLGQGIKFGFRDARGVSLAAWSADLFERSRLEKSGGFPVFDDAPEEIDVVEIEADGDLGRIGLILAENRSAYSGDISLAGGMVGTGTDRTRLSIEFVKSVSGRFADLGDSRFFDVDWDDISIGRVSNGLPDDIVIASEITGLEREVGGIGRFGIIPSYRYCGERFLWNKGEDVPGTVENSIISWWKHSRLSIYARVEYVDSYSSSQNENTRIVSGLMRMEFKDGFESTERIMAAEGRRPTLILSLSDDRYGSRVRMLARLDDTGGDNLLSFLAEGDIDLHRSWSLRSTLFRQNTGVGHYSMEVEFRPENRFLFRAGFGSYLPANEAPSLLHDPVPRYVEKERSITFYTRIWLGEMIK